MSSKQVKTDVGSFMVSIKDDILIDTITRAERIVGTLISVGGRRACVFIKAPNTGDTGILDTVRTKGQGCEVHNKMIRGDASVHLVLLAFTVLRSVSPHIRFLELDDRSNIEIDLNGTLVGMSLASYELLFHQATWYERHFHAILKDETLRKVYSKEGFYRERSEPSTQFDFRNRDLQALMEPLIMSAPTWKSFLDEVYTFKNRAQLVYPWYRQALADIMGPISFESQRWVIDVYNQDLKSIQFLEVGGSRRRTRRQRGGFSDSENNKYYDEITYEELYNMRFSGRTSR
jgi:hypothetical protein